MPSHLTSTSCAATAIRHHRVARSAVCVPKSQTQIPRQGQKLRTMQERWPTRDLVASETRHTPLTPDHASRIFVALCYVLVARILVICVGVNLRSACSATPSPCSETHTRQRRTPCLGANVTRSRRQRRENSSAFICSFVGQRADTGFFASRPFLFCYAPHIHLCDGRSEPGRIPWRVSSNIFPAVIGGPGGSTTQRRPKCALSGAANDIALRRSASAVWTPCAVLEV